MKGISTCKLHLCGDHTIIFHDVLFAPGIRRNLIFVVALLILGFSLNFSGNFVRINYGNVFYRSRHVESCFVVFDSDINTYNYMLVIVFL